MEEWQEQIKNSVNTIERIKTFINLTSKEAFAIQNINAKWGTSPYFASLMDKNNSDCAIRKQVIPSIKETKTKYGIQNYLIWKENRIESDACPDSIARQYKDRVAFTVTDVCLSYCRHCFRKELIIDRSMNLRIDVSDGLNWISDHQEIRDVLITGGDPFILSDEELEYIIRKLREIKHIEMIRIGTRAPIVLPQRITNKLKKVLRSYHKVPIWINTQCNHPKEITEQTAEAVYKLITCGVNVGNQSVLLKGINDDIQILRKLNQKLLSIRIRPYYLFYCEPAPGVDHFRTTIERGAELIRDALQGHTTGLAIPMYVVATNIGKIPLMANYYIENKSDNEYTLTNYEGLKIMATSNNCLFGP